jgi:hypothetical protein
MRPSRHLKIESYLNDYIKAYFDDFCKRLRKLETRLNYVINSQKPLSQFADDSAPFIETQQEFYNMVYLPYYEKGAQIIRSL